LTQQSRSPASQLGGQAAFFFLGNVFTLLVGLPLQIYVARMLGAGGLGVFSLIDGGVSLAAGLIAFGQAPTLVKFIPFHLERGEFPCVRQLVARGATLLLAAGGLAYGVALLILPLAARYWPVVAEYRSAVIVMALLIPLSLISFFLQQGLRGFQEIRFIVVGSSFLQLTVKALLSLVLLTAGLHLMGYVWAVVLSVACAAAWMAVGLKRRLSAMPSPVETNCTPKNRDAWGGYARVMYTGSLLGTGGSYLDRFLLGAFAGSNPVGILAVVKQLQQMPVIFLQMFLAVAAPMFSAAHSRGASDEIQHIYHLTTDWVIRLSAPLFIFFFLFAEPLLRLYGEQFAEDGVYPFRILLAGQIVNLGFGPVGNVMDMSGMERQALKLAAYQMVFTVLGFLLLVPTLGLVGAAWVISAAVVFSNVANFRIAKKTMRLRWSDARYWRWIMPASVSVAIGIALNQFGPAHVGVAFLGACLLSLYALFHVLSFAQGIHDDDRDLFLHLRAQLLSARPGAH
jgi:O-antigen/teichoic acid export membrane protein